MNDKALNDTQRRRCIRGKERREEEGGEGRERARVCVYVYVRWGGEKREVYKPPLPLLYDHNFSSSSSSFFFFQTSHYDVAAKFQSKGFPTFS